jgi:capsular exopolysaccharide synthesis family protein
MPLDPAPTPEAHFVDEPPPGLVPMIRSAPIRLAADAPLLPFGGGHYRAGEQYRIVRTKIVHHPLQPRFLVVSSASSGDGKTVSAINIAATLALKSDVNVLLVDADFRRSSLATMLGLPAQPGLAEVLEGTCQLQDAILRSEQLANLYLLPGGKARSNPAELLDSPDWRRVSAVFRKEFHFVVVDAPPVTGVADYELIQAVCDGVVVVVRPDNSNRKLCFKALETVPKEKFVGVLVNCFPEWFLWKTHEYYSYSSE